MAGTLALAGCATIYTPEDSSITGGYSDVQLGPDLYRITVQANGYTTEERAQEIMLLRAANLTVSRGYEKFKVVDEKTKSNTDIYASTYSFSEFHKPHGASTVKLLHTTDPGAADAYDAVMIKANLTHKLSRP